MTTNTKKLEKLLSEGEKSDDGNQWVHKSGFVLKDTILTKMRGMMTTE